MVKLDIITIRDKLNEVTFEEGKRCVCIGVATELFAGLDDATVVERLDEFERELESHDLSLLRGTDDSDELYVEQTLKQLETSSVLLR